MAEIQFVQQLAAQFSVALEHSELLERFRTQTQQFVEANQALAQANSELENLSKVDALTQISNRRCFDEYLDQEWNRLRQSEETLSLILFDLDYFKAYNDYYGHLSGDHCLRQVAGAAKTILNRSSDLLARYGGEEFVVVLPNTGESGAIRVAELIQHSIRELKIPHAKNQSGGFFVSVSIGIASRVPAIGSSQQDLIDAADQALYRAKDQGRNRWIHATQN